MTSAIQNRPQSTFNLKPLVQKANSDIGVATAAAVAQTFSKSATVSFALGTAIGTGGVVRMVKFAKSNGKDGTFLGNAAQIVGGAALTLRGIPGMMGDLSPATNRFATLAIGGGIAYNAADKYIHNDIARCATKWAISATTVATVLETMEKEAFAVCKYTPHIAVIGAVVGGLGMYIYQQTK